MMLLSDSVGGAEDSKNGLSNLMPEKVMEQSALMDSSFYRFRRQAGFGAYLLDAGGSAFIKIVRLKAI
jgi:hypothetical protein